MPVSNKYPGRKFDTNEIALLHYTENHSQISGQNRVSLKEAQHNYPSDMSKTLMFVKLTV